MNRSFFLVPPLLILIGCKSEPPAWKRNRFSEIDISGEMGPIHLPRGLWSRVVSVFYGDSPKGSTQEPLPSVFSPLRLYFLEKNRGILLRGNTVIEFAAGGGEIDLSDVIARKNGSFYLAAEFLPEMEDIDRRVFFLSNGVQRRIGRDLVGAGCDTYFEISKFFARSMKQNGFMLNTTDGRHVSALAGTYFFAAATKDKLYLATLVIKDSTYKSALCP